MSGSNRLVAIEAASTDAAGDEFLLTEEEAIPTRPGFEDPEVWEAEAEEVEFRQVRRWHADLLPIAAVLAIAGWTGLFAWSQTGQFGKFAEVSQWISWLRDWSGPVLLILLAWNLIARSSTKQAERFGNAARQLAEESEKLEARLTAINGELSLGREFIAAQARDLDTIGRTAIERMSQNAGQLQDLIQGNADKIESISSVSTAALENMEKLRGQLPVIANSARDVSNNIGNSGRSAHAQLQELISGFKRLNEFGQASERQVESLRTLVESTCAEFTRQADQLGEVSNQKLAGLAAMGDEFDAKLQRQREDALVAIRTGAEELAKELTAAREQLDASSARKFADLGEKALAGIAAMEARIAAMGDRSVAISQRLRESEDSAIDAFAERLSRIDAEISARSEKYSEHSHAIAANCEAAAQQVARIEGQIGQISSQVAEAAKYLGSSTESLVGQLATGRDALGVTKAEVGELTDSTVRLLELIQASSQHSREIIPQALGEAELKLEGVESRVRTMLAASNEMAQHGSQLEQSVLTTQESIARAAREIEALHAGMGSHADAHGEALGKLRETLGELEQSSMRAASHAQGELAQAIAQLEVAARGAVEGIGTTSATAVADVAAKLGSLSAEAIDKAMESRAEAVVGLLEEAAARAAESSREAAKQLRDQLAMVNKLAGNLERRVAHARERAEEKLDNDFSRRVALITESLNSSAIDIARALNADVSDVAWAKYLKGDRGIFTRRAVSLIQASEAKAILQHYEQDSNFRDHVSRFIHDFEAMLRQILSTRDGHALSVTLLSSDMGKLYVALAQAIERLRN